MSSAKGVAAFVDVLNASRRIGYPPGAVRGTISASGEVEVFVNLPPPGAAPGDAFQPPEVKARTVAREAALDSMNATPPASLDEAVLAINATETKRSAPKQIYDPSVERKKPQHGSSSSRKRSRTPTPVGGIIPNAEGRPPKRSAAAAMERTVLNRA